MFPTGHLFAGWPSLVELGLTQNMTCSLRNFANENHEHLFFQCSYASSLWRSVLSLNGVPNLSMDMYQIISWAVQNRKGKSFKHKLLKLSLCAAVYHIWQERNFRLFQTKPKPVVDLLSNLIEDIRWRVASWNNIENNQTSRTIICAWGFSL